MSIKIRFESKLSLSLRVLGLRLSSLALLNRLVLNIVRGVIII